MRGAGDLVEALARLLGVKRAEECGCEHRRDLLNKMFPFPRWRRRRRDNAGRGIW